MAFLLGTLPPYREPPHTREVIEPVPDVVKEDAVVGSATVRE
jgi:hypothetical protein